MSSLGALLFFFIKCPLYNLQCPCTACFRSLKHCFSCHLYFFVSNAHQVFASALLQKKYSSHLPRDVYNAFVGFDKLIRNCRRCVEEQTLLIFRSHNEDASMYMIRRLMVLCFFYVYVHIFLLHSCCYLSCDRIYMAGGRRCFYLYSVHMSERERDG